MKRRMVLSAVCMVMAAATLTLSGCPALGIGGNPTLGKIVVHNNYAGEHNVSIIELSAVRVPDECSNQTPEGVNLLPEPIVVGDSYTVKDLPEGRYYCRASGMYDCDDPYDGRCGYSDSGYVTVAAGGTVDWYFQ